MSFRKHVKVSHVYCRKMLDTETSKEQKLKEVHVQLDILQNEKKEIQNDKAQLMESLALKEEDIKQLRHKVIFRLV